MEIELQTYFSHFSDINGILDISPLETSNAIVRYGISRNRVDVVKKYAWDIKRNIDNSLFLLKHFRGLSDEVKNILYSMSRCVWFLNEIIYIHENFDVDDIPQLSRINDFKGHFINALYCDNVSKLRPEMVEKMRAVKI